MEEITASELEYRFAEGQLFTEGGIRIWKDETGKFGDPVYRIESLKSDKESGKLVLKLSNNEVIEIAEPSGFLVDKNKFVVQKASGISWHQSGIRILSYTLKGQSVTTRAAIPYKHFDTSAQAHAFEIYTL